MSCIVEYAKRKTDEWDDDYGDGFGEFLEPWARCSICKQYFQHELAVNMANEFVLYAEGIDPGGPKHLGALSHKLSVIFRAGRK